MSIYQILGVVAAVIIFALFFHLVGPASSFLVKVLDIHLLDDFGRDPVYTAALRLAYLAGLAVIVRLILGR